VPALRSNGIVFRDGLLGPGGESGPIEVAPVLV